MREGWLVDPGTNWVWRFHRDDKAWVRSPKVFMDRGMPMPDGQPPLLKECRHVPKEDVETIWRNLKSSEESGQNRYGVPIRIPTGKQIPQALSPADQLRAWRGEELR